jgi:coenzyme F420-reducing hydrogenase delta subunit
MVDFDPKIIAFCCDQSGYPSLDMANSLRLNFPKNVEIVRVPCGGRIEAHHLLRALETGADGVILFICYEENCQFLRGNLRVKGRILYLHKILEKIGIEKERIEVCYLATNNGVKLIEALNRKAEELKRLGPNPCK